MQIWRMRPDGNGQEQVTSDRFNNWFAHISPDGKWMVFLTYDKDVTGHPENKDVMLRLMPLGGEKKITVLAKALRRTGHHQRAFVVTRQSAAGFCQLSHVVVTIVAINTNRRESHLQIEGAWTRSIWR